MAAEAGARLSQGETPASLREPTHQQDSWPELATTLNAGAGLPWCQPGVLCALPAATHQEFVATLLGETGRGNALGRVGRALPADHRSSNMKLDDATFRLLRRLAPVLDDVLNAGEVEHADQAVNLSSLAQLCSQLFDAYHNQHPDDIAQARLDALESQ